jgi:hypothetical protein
MLPDQNAVYYPEELSLLGQIPRSGGAVIAAEYADASKSRGDRKKHLGLCSHR